ncbi:Uncharacterised protein [Enterobacter hormaechei]|nr:Uncharacterised protein [Enterobacter hormaechei]
MQVRQRLGQLIRITQDIAGDFVQLRAHDIGHVSAFSQRNGVEQVRQFDRLFCSEQALRGQCHLFGQQVRRRTSTGRHGQAIGHGVTGNFQRPGDIVSIETPQHDRHDDVILRALAVCEDASHPWQIERQQLTLLICLALIGSDLF